MKSLQEIKAGNRFSVCIRPKDAQSLINPSSNRLLQVADEVIIGAYKGQKRPRLNPRFKWVVLNPQASATKNFSKLSKQVTTDWILHLDSDELIADQDISRLLYLLQHPILPAYEFPVRHYDPSLPMEQLKKCSGDYPVFERGKSFYCDRLAIRLYRKDAGIHFQNDFKSAIVSGKTTLRAEPLRCFIPIHRLSTEAELQASYNRDCFVLSIYQARVTQDPTDIDAYIDQAYFYMHRSKIKEAFDSFKAAYQINPQEPNVLLNMGYLLMESRSFDKATMILEKLLELDPQHAGALSNLGVIYLRTQRYEEALKCFQAAEALQPSNPSVYSNMATTFVRLGKRDDAIKCFEKAIEIRPDNCQYSAELAMVHLSRGDVEAAHHHLKNAHTRDQKHPQVLFGLGYLHYQLGEVEEALNYWKPLAHFHPQRRETQQVHQLLQQLHQKEVES